MCQNTCSQVSRQKLSALKCLPAFGCLPALKCLDQAYMPSRVQTKSACLAMHQNACFRCVDQKCLPSRTHGPWCPPPLDAGSKMHIIFLRVRGNMFLHPEVFLGGVEVFLRVREAKTKKCAILWTLNVTVMPAWLGHLVNLGYSKYMKR
jgi:hypothetical protein